MQQLLRGAACALRYVNPEDEQAVELQDYITENGIEAAIAKYTGASYGGSMFRRILDEYHSLG